MRGDRTEIVIAGKTDEEREAGIRAARFMLEVCVLAARIKLVVRAYSGVESDQVVVYVGTGESAYMTTKMMVKKSEIKRWGEEGVWGREAVRVVEELLEKLVKKRELIR